MLLSVRLAWICALLAFPLAATGGPDPEPLRGGTVTLTLDPDALSTLPVDVEVLKGDLCSARTSNAGTIRVVPPGPRGECDLFVSVQPTGGIIFQVGAWDGTGAQLIGEAQALAMTAGVGSTPISTACGDWDVTMVLDPGSEQPVSTLTLAAAEGTPGRGVFSGVLDLAVVYLFTHRTDGTRLEAPAGVSLEAAGRWSTLPVETPGLTAEASNVALFATGTQGAFGAAPGCATWADTPCGFCLSFDLTP